MASSSKPSKHGDLDTDMASAKPSKQRKRLFNAPQHKRRRMLSAHLNEDLANKYNTRHLPIRTGDSVRIMRGDFAGLEGKVEKVEYSTGRIFVEGMVREKAAGVSSKLPVHASKVLVTNLSLSDKWRSGILTEKSKEQTA